MYYVSNFAQSYHPKFSFLFQEERRIFSSSFFNVSTIRSLPLLVQDSSFSFHLEEYVKKFVKNCDLLPKE